MGRRRFKPEQIIHMLREAEIKLAGGKTIGEGFQGAGDLGGRLTIAGERRTGACRSRRPSG